MFAEAADHAWSAQNGGLRVAGYPNRFDLTVTAPRLSDAATGYGWQGGDLTLLAMTWKPWHLIALAPLSQRITTPEGEIALTATKLRGSLRLTPDSNLALQGIVVEAADLALSGPRGRFGIARAILATEADTSRRHSYRIGVQVTGLTPDPAVSVALSGLPGVMGGLRLDAHLLLSGPVDRHAAEAPPQVTGVILDSADLDWGPLQVTARGTLATVSDGTAEGRIDLHLENWRLFPAVLGQSGLIDPVLAPTLLRAMEIMAESSPDPQVLETALTFKSGWVRFGPLPIGAAPRIGYRQ
jgi:hypothetical protein